MLLTYHEVRPEQAAYVYSVTRAQFRRHIDVVSEYHTGSKDPLICFDDGHESTYKEALPILSERGHRAIHFITAGWIGQRCGYMNWSELRTLLACGQEIQSHSWSHPFLTECSDTKLEIELRHSKQVLEDRLGIEMNAISMPGGRWDGRVAAACRKAGYRRLFVSDPFLATRQAASGIELVGRLMVRNSMDAAAIRGWITGQNRPFGKAWAKSRVIGAVRQLVGDSAYVRLWRLLGSKETTVEFKPKGIDS